MEPLPQWCLPSNFERSSRKKCYLSALEEQWRQYWCRAIESVPRQDLRTRNCRTDQYWPRMLSVFVRLSLRTVGSGSSDIGKHCAISTSWDCLTGETQVEKTNHGKDQGGRDQILEGHLSKVLQVLELPAGRGRPCLWLFFVRAEWFDTVSILLTNPKVVQIKANQNVNFRNLVFVGAVWARIPAPSAHKIVLPQVNFSWETS